MEAPDSVPHHHLNAEKQVAGEGPEDAGNRYGDLKNCK